MLFWLTLLLIIIVISFILAFLSIEKGGLFLVRNKDQITVDFLNALYDFLVKQNSVFSIERLYKGNKTTLVVFGPKSFLMPYAQRLNLLELTDYTAHINPANITTIETNTVTNFHLKESEQFWRQFILHPAGKKQKFFDIQTREIYISATQKEVTNVSSRILDFYRNRKFIKNKYNRLLTSEGVLRLASII